MARTTTRADTDPQNRARSNRRNASRYAGKPAWARARLTAAGGPRAAAAWLATPLVALLAVAALGLSGCDSGGETHPASPGTANAPRPRFAVTVHPAAAILREVVEGRADITRILPTGASPHTYEPRPSDVRAASDALALFYVAGNLDEWAAQFPAKRRVALIDLLPPADRLDMGEFHHSHEGEQGREGESEHPGHIDTDSDTDSDRVHPPTSPENREGEAGHPGSDPADREENLDPHFWMDPLAVKAVLPGLAEALSELDPGGREVYQRNATRFAVELDDLDRRLADILSPTRGAAVVLHHPSVRYLLNRYGFRLLGVIEESPGKEPSPRAIQDLVSEMKAAGVKAVFNEPQLASRPVEVIAEAAGVSVRMLDPLGGEPGRETYSDLLLFNAKALEEGTR